MQHLLVLVRHFNVLFTFNGIHIITRTSRSLSGGGEGLLFLLPLPRDFPSEAPRNRSDSESLMVVDGLWIVPNSPEI